MEVDSIKLYKEIEIINLCLNVIHNKHQLSIHNFCSRKTCSLVCWFCKYNRYVIPSISRCSWQPTDIYKYGYTTIDIYMAAKEITRTLSFTFCLFKDGCDGEQEDIKATI